MIQKAITGANIPDKTASFLSFKLFSIELHSFCIIQEHFPVDKGIELKPNAHSHNKN